MSLPEGWAEAELFDIADLHDNKRVPLNAAQRAEMPGDFPYYGANGQVGSVGDFLFEGKHILVAEDGGHFDQPERGVAYEVDGRFWVNNHAHILSTCGDIPTGYITRLLNTLDWLQYVSGTTRLKLTQGGMKRIKFPLPPLAEQRRIVAKLDALTARLTRAGKELDRVPVLAERMRQAAVKDAFAGALTTKWRDDNPGHSAASLDDTAEAYVSLAGVMRRKPTAEIDWKPEIELPEGWRWASIDELIAAAQYGSSSKTSDDDSGVPVFRMGNIQRGELDWTNLKFLPFDHSEFPGLFLDEGDVLFNRTNSFELVGKSAVFRGHERPVSYASYLIRLKCSAILPDLLARYINSPYGRAWIDKVASQQVGQANVNGTKLKALGIPLAPAEEQKEILRILDNAFARADRLEAEAAKARALLDRMEAAILARAFRGELVPQDPADEPASALLDRIRAQRAAAPKPKRGRRKKADA